MASVSANASASAALDGGNSVVCERDHGDDFSSVRDAFQACTVPKEKSFKTIIFSDNSTEQTSNGTVTW
ncbi:hypothetical protein HNQ71_007114 [Mesorhizobium sangaii]|uniref:Uncharacterized protein n=1 Tax=Mesorhizobium sangaii TaxID=505389 RepID=A0A841PGI6_9HYPH|nr:hypothetical protein [Mesorhizobium sangaii]